MRCCAMLACSPAAATRPQRRFLPDFLTDRTFFEALCEPRAGRLRVGRAGRERWDWRLRAAAAPLRREAAAAFIAFAFLLGLACTSSLAAASLSSSLRRRS